MKKLVKNSLGVFVLEDGKVVDYKEFSHGLPELVKKLSKKTEEEEYFEEKYGSLERTVVDIEQLNEKIGTVLEKDELYSLVKKVGTEYTRQEIKSAQEHDQILIQAVRRLSELEKELNKKTERLKAWYSLYFPELENNTKNNEEYLEKVLDIFYRKDIIEELDLEKSTGLELDDQDLRLLKTFSESVKRGFEEKESLEKYVENLAKRIIPNISAVLGEVVAAKLVSEAGSLKKFARMPSSTVQVLGAEKALFRHMKGEGSAPKHGTIFLHPCISSLPNNKRGKMARYLSNKAVLAGRLDMYNGEFKGDEYREEVDKKYEELKRS